MCFMAPVYTADRGPGADLVRPGLGQSVTHVLGSRRTALDPPAFDYDAPMARCHVLFAMLGALGASVAGCGSANEDAPSDGAVEDAAPDADAPRDDGPGGAVRVRLVAG